MNLKINLCDIQIGADECWLPTVERIEQNAVANDSSPLSFYLLLCGFLWLGRNSCCFDHCVAYTHTPKHEFAYSLCQQRIELLCLFIPYLWDFGIFFFIFLLCSAHFPRAAVLQTQTSSSVGNIFLYFDLLYWVMNVSMRLAAGVASNSV